MIKEREMIKEIEIGGVAVRIFDAPHWCRNVFDKVRWLALASGLLPSISLADEVEYIPKRDAYRLRRRIA